MPKAPAQVDTAAKPAPPRLLDVLRETAQQKGHSPATITAWIRWVAGFVRFHRQRHPREMKAMEVGRFLQSVGQQARDPLVAIEEARTALEFLYQDVLLAARGRGGIGKTAAMAAGLA
jgi:hypothetical protein